jgi:hypothetical protein
MDPEAEETGSVNISTGDDNSDTNALDSSQVVPEKNKNGSLSPSENGVDVGNDRASIGSEGKEVEPVEMVIYSSLYIYFIICMLNFKMRPAY